MSTLFSFFLTCQKWSELGEELAISFISVFPENPLQLYPRSRYNGWVQTCHLARHPYSMLPMYAKHPKQSVNNKDFKWQARSGVNDKGQLASMQPLSVKDKSHGVTTHMGTWKIYGSRTHNPQEPGCCSCFLSFCQQPCTEQFHDPVIIPLRCVSDDRKLIWFDMWKHKDAHILVNKRESDESSEYGGRIQEY